MYNAYRGFISCSIILLSYLAVGKSDTRIAFVKDTNLAPKCALDEQETFQKPFVLLRMAPTNPNVEAEVNDDEIEENNVGASAHDHKKYGLVELSKLEVQQLMNSGNLQLIAIEDENVATPIIELYHENIGDAVDGDGRSKKRPWRKIQRIIQRQVIKKPKRYFKKIVHIFG